MENEYMRYGLEMKTLSTVISGEIKEEERRRNCLLYTSPSPRD